MTINQLNDLFACKTNRELADYLHIELHILTYLAYKQPSSRYVSFTIPKRQSNSYRIIEAPRADLKRIQRAIADELQNYYLAPRSTYGFVKDKSMPMGACWHVKKRTVLSLDLEDFFHSISSSRVHGVFKNICRCSPEVANTLTNLTCLDGKLPQGAPSSPILSNMICYSMDRALMNYATSHRLVYTRYADDLIFSTTSAYLTRYFYDYNKTGIDAINSSIRHIIEDLNSFKINEEKIRIRGRGTRQLVTGIIVNEKCNFTRRTYRNLRVLFHNINVKGYKYSIDSYLRRFPEYEEALLDNGNLSAEEKLLNHIRGRLTYLTMITSVNRKPSDPLIKLWTMYHEITNQKVPMINYDYFIYRTISDSSAQPDNTGVHTYQVNGTAIRINGYYVTCRHCVTDLTSPDPGAFYSVEISKPEKLNCHTQSNCDTEISLQFDYDIAWCKVEDASECACEVTLNYKDFPQMGDTVIAVGYPGDHNTPQFVKTTVTSIQSDYSEIGVDRAFIHGMSGGAVFNQRHELIGILHKGGKVNEYFHNGAFIPIMNLLGRAPFQMNEPVKEKRDGYA